MSPWRSTTLLAAALLPGAALLVGAFPAPAQEGAGASSRAVLTGTVASALDGNPVPAASVIHVESGRRTATDSSGRFRLENLPPGSVTIRVASIGLGSNQVTVPLRENTVTEAVLLFSPEVLRLEELQVSVRRERNPRLRAFERRRAQGIGYFLTPREIREADARLPSDLLRRVPGVVVGSRTTGGTRIRFGRGDLGGGLDCPPLVYVDGVHRPGLNFDELNVEDLLAVEVYQGASEIPARFRRHASYCGVLVVWTEDGVRRGGDGR